MQRDAIDFGRTRIPQLFVKLFVPTLLGLLFTAVVTLADGIFVGRGVGSDALAAINIATPMFQIAMGIALMFGSGVSIVAAIHLSQGNVKAARIIPIFILLPSFLGDRGLWLAVPLSEICTWLVIIAYAKWKFGRKRQKS